MFPLGGQLVILGDHGPAVGQHLTVIFALVDHRLNGDCHSGTQLHASARRTIMHDLGLFMEDPANTVSTIVPNYAVVIGFGMLLDHMANIAQPGARTHELNTFIEAFLGDAHQAFTGNGRLAHKKHFAGVAMKAVFDDRHINVDDVAILKHFLIRRNAVADDMVDRGADRFGETLVIERGGDGLLHLSDVLVADAVELARGHAGFYVFADHLQHLGGQAAGNAHAFDFFGRLDRHIHGHYWLLLVLVIGDHSSAIARWLKRV